MSQNKWHKPADRLPPLHTGVLVQMRDAVGKVFDVACYAGKDTDGAEHWILADIRLASKQIARWQLIRAVQP